MSRYPSHLSPNITPTKPTKSQKSRARREPSGVFSLFQPQQIQQFKEAFSLIDQDRDGLVGEQDLKDTFASLGTHPYSRYRVNAFIHFVKRHLAVARDDGRVAHVTPR
jgi:myosin regulatory light chain 12